MRVLVTGGSGVLGRPLAPLLRTAGHDVAAPAHTELDLFDPDAVATAVAGAGAVYHLATRIPPASRAADAAAWQENDRLRAVATGLVVDAALAVAVPRLVLPTITFVYPPGPADESTPAEAVRPMLASALTAEAHVGRFTAAGGSGVVLRLGLLDGPGTGNDEPKPVYGDTLHVEDAAAALLAALDLPAGTYNVVRDGERVSNARFRAATGWAPRH